MVAGLILLLILLNGFFALAETAVVSSRRYKLAQLAEAGRRAHSALALYDHPTRFLSTVQIGITLIGVLTGAFGASALAEPLARTLARLSPLEPYSEGLSLAFVVAAITYASLVLGELLPKRLALNQPETLALRVAGPMTALARLAAPAVALLSWSTRGLLRLLGQTDRVDSVSEDDIAGLARQGLRSGVLEDAEQEIIENLFWFGDRPVSTLLTPRRDVAWLDLSSDAEEMRARVRQHAHSYFVVSDGELDSVQGIVSSRDLLLASLSEEQLELAPLLQAPLFLPATLTALGALEQFKRRGVHLGLVVDEYGGVEGLLTLRDLFEGLVGNIPTAEELERPKAVRRADDSWLADGLLSIDDFKELFDIGPFEDDALEAHATLGGFVVAQLGHIPDPAESFAWSGLHFEVVDMDQGRVDKVLVSSAAPDEET